MATINQLNKQIETANKRMADYQRKAEMYAARVAKTLAKVRKLTGNNEVTAENAKQILNIKEDYKQFDLWCALTNANDYEMENRQHAEREQRNIERMAKEIERLATEQQTHNEEIAPLERALTMAMVEFKEQWMRRMMGWYEKYYDMMRTKLDEATNRRKRADNLRRYFRNVHGWHTYQKVQKYLERVCQYSTGIIMDEANRMAKADYMAKKDMELSRAWNNGIVKLADKCRKYGLDESRIEAQQPSVTEKGFETVVSDGSNRIIYARVIWAAEYSEYVAPHTRYIVTERRK